MFIELSVAFLLISLQRYRSVVVDFPFRPMYMLCIFWTRGWSVEVKYLCTLRTRGRSAEGGLCLSLPGRWNKLKSIGNTFCPLSSSLIMDTKHISVWETPDTVMFSVIVYLIHVSDTLYKLGAQFVLISVQCAFYFFSIRIQAASFFSPFPGIFYYKTWVEPGYFSFFFFFFLQRYRKPKSLRCFPLFSTYCFLLVNQCTPYKSIIAISL